jgi:hypothetical protein
MAGHGQLASSAQSVAVDNGDEGFKGSFDFIVSHLYPPDFLFTIMM